MIRSGPTPLGLAAIAATVLLRAGATAADAPKAFPHELHLELVEGRCPNCHGFERPGVPQLRGSACAECHGNDVPRYLPPTPLPGRERGLSALFPHRRHVQDVDCRECHQPMPAKAGRDWSTRAQCLACHEKPAVAAGRCTKCHDVDAATVRPADHDATWLKRHGDEAALDAGIHGKDCRGCHADDACKRCHRVTLPRDHTSLFRIRLHGTEAAWDRDRCRTCHETGTCIRCHATTAPMNHTGAWVSLHPLAASSTRDEGCLACHRASFCDACHLGKR